MTERKEAVRAELDVDTRQPLEASCCLGMDALRMSLGKPTKNYSPATVASWIAYLASHPLSSMGDGE